MLIPSATTLSPMEVSSSISAAPAEDTSVISAHGESPTLPAAVEEPELMSVTDMICDNNVSAAGEVVNTLDLDESCMHKRKASPSLSEAAAVSAEGEYMSMEDKALLRSIECVDSNMQVAATAAEEPQAKRQRVLESETDSSALVSLDSSKVIGDSDVHTDDGALASKNEEALSIEHAADCGVVKSKAGIVEILDSSSKVVDSGSEAIAKLSPQKQTEKHTDDCGINSKAAVVDTVEKDCGSQVLVDSFLEAIAKTSPQKRTEGAIETDADCGVNSKAAIVERVGEASDSQKLDNFLADIATISPQKQTEEEIEKHGADYGASDSKAGIVNTVSEDCGNQALDTLAVDTLADIGKMGPQEHTEEEIEEHAANYGVNSNVDSVCSSQIPESLADIDTMSPQELTEGEESKVLDSSLDDKVKMSPLQETEDSATGGLLLGGCYDDCV